MGESLYSKLFTKIFLSDPPPGGEWYQILLIILLLLGPLSLIVLGMEKGMARGLSAFGLILDLSGVVQLQVSGFFAAASKHLEESDLTPSHIVRKVIDNPDAPIRTAIRNALFAKSRTGFLLLCAGFFLQFLAQLF